MAARRLVMIMIALLVLSTVAAILIPDPRRDRDGDSTGTTGATGATAATGATGLAGAGGAAAAGGGGGNGATGAEPNQPMPEVEPQRGGDGGRIVEAVLNASAKRPERVAARPGDRVILQVRAETGVDVAIPRLGLYGTATEYAPAVFDTIVTAPGTYPVSVVGGDLIAGLIVVAPGSSPASG